MKIELIVFALISSVLSNNVSRKKSLAINFNLQKQQKRNHGKMSPHKISFQIANKVEEVIRQFISEKRSEVSQGVARVNEVLRNHNAEAAKYLIRAHDKINDENLRQILNQEIDRLHDFDYDRIEAMAISSIENLDELAKIVTNECVIKYWNDYIDDVLKALSAIDVHQSYGKHEVMNCAMALAKKVH